MYRDHGLEAHIENITNSNHQLGWCKRLRHNSAATRWKVLRGARNENHLHFRTAQRHLCRYIRTPKPGIMTSLSRRWIGPS
jgi:hypothetical protein